MAKFDPRVDDLVMETRTLWDDSVGDLTDGDRQWVASEIHKSPEQAKNLKYERSHTGFTRVITVTLEDIQRLYLSKEQA